MAKNTITLTHQALNDIIAQAVSQVLASSAPAKKSTGRKAPVKKVLNHNGKLRTPAQAANDLRLHEQREQRLAKMSKKERKAYDEMVANIVANKEAEQDRTRALEKALKVKAGSFKSTAVSVSEAMDAGWKPKATGKAERREELKAIKAQIRG